MYKIDKEELQRVINENPDYKHEDLTKHFKCTRTNIIYIIKKHNLNYINKRKENKPTKTRIKYNIDLLTSIENLTDESYGLMREVLDLNTDLLYGNTSTLLERLIKQQTHMNILLKEIIKT